MMNLQMQTFSSYALDQIRVAQQGVCVNKRSGPIESENEEYKTDINQPGPSDEVATIYHVSDSEEKK